MRAVIALFWCSIMFIVLQRPSFWQQHYIMASSHIEQLQLTVATNNPDHNRPPTSKTISSSDQNVDVRYKKQL